MMPAETTADVPSPRQAEVLEVVLRLLVAGGEALTMTAVSQRASCSKETLYKWFGDREGLLTATVKWQAAKVAVGSVEADLLDADSLAERLEEFAANWLTVISSDTSIALNRVAVGHAGSGRGNLGAIVLQHGRLAMGERLKPVLEAGRARGLLGFDDAEEAFRTFFGLIGRDVQIRLLLGDELPLSAAAVAREAARATSQFLALHGAEGEAGKARARVL